MRASCGKLLQLNECAFASVVDARENHLSTMLTEKRSPFDTTPTYV